MKIEHHGQYIEKIIRRNGHSITDIARLTKVNRRSVYNWFNLPRLKPSILKAIEQAMQCDFSDAFPELIENSTDYNQTPPIMSGAEQKVQLQVDHWKNKYVELLEKYIELLSLRPDEGLKDLYRI
jgi:hypothetical protein